MECPREDTLAELADGQLEAGARHELLAHLEQCPSCDALVADLARAITPDDARARDELVTVGSMIDRYRILACLGEGAMGAVYRARDPKLDRDVALKLQRSGAHPGAAIEQALAEARALARLSHPHIVQVHDVGECGGRTFLVMDLVDGVSLREALALRRRTYASALHDLAPVADALAAAHRAEVVHGDIKPDNLLVARDGRVLVADFGLARMRSDRARSGFTPAYAAPEQLAGAPASEASDQFAFAATLHECAVGRRDARVPYAELARAFSAGQWDAASRRRLPRHARSALARAFALEPARRFGSVAELVAALRAGVTRARRRRGIAAGVAGLTACAALVLSLRGQQPAETCSREGAAALVHPVWSRDRAQALARSLASIAHPRAHELAAAVTSGLDEYGTAIVDMSVASCRATAGGTQSADMLDRRAACLEARRRELAAFVTALDRPLTPHELELAAGAAHGLRAVSDCAELDALAGLEQTSNVGVRVRAASIEDELSAASADERLGRFAPALARANAALVRARRLDFAPALARAANTVATVELRLGKYEPMLEHYRLAAETASRGGDLVLAVNTLSTIAQVVAIRMQKPGEAAVWLHAGEILAAGHALGPKVEARLHTGRKLIAEMAGDQATALREAEAAVNVYEPEGEDSTLAALLVELGTARVRMHAPGAGEAWQRALRIDERVLGPNHPSLATVLSNLGLLKIDDGEFAAGEALMLRAQAIREASLGPDHPEVGLSHTNLAQAYLEHGDLEKGRAHLDAAARIFDRALGPDHMYQARVLELRGDLELSTREYASAEASHRRALAITAKAYGADAPQCAADQIAIGQAQLEQHRAGDALASLRRGKQLAASLQSSEGEVLRLSADFYLARAQYETGDHAAALQIARTVAAALHARPAAPQLRVAEVDRWLHDHGG